MSYATYEFVHVHIVFCSGPIPENGKHHLPPIQPCQIQNPRQIQTLELGLPRETTSFADKGTWTNIDADVTPLDRRTSLVYFYRVGV